MSQYTYRPWQEGDDLKLLEIWPDPQNTQQAAFRSTFSTDSSQPWRTTIVGQDQGIPIAAASAYETSLHPQHLWAYIEVAPDHQGQGLASALLDRLIQAVETAQLSTRSLRIKVASGSAAEKFALARGFQKIQQSRIIHINPGALPLLPLGLAPDGQPSQSIEDIATGSVELTQEFWDFYRRSHQWDPPANISLGQVNRLFLSDQAQAYGAIVLRKRLDSASAAGPKGKIMAFAISYQPLEVDAATNRRSQDQAAEVLLGYSCSGQQAREAIGQLLAVLVAQYPVTLEVSEAMVELNQILDQLIGQGRARVLEDTLMLTKKF
ncbi:MAG: GNAT family N-acetyltransferase [Rothia sp. (in: high G+C Gram-positive bacteria)]|nr:GNAT family N-acetyltransferase [Rothia sp. (in: high G+C Gram-positive bacteria)]